MFAMLGGAMGTMGDFAQALAAQAAAGLEVITDGRETIPNDDVAAAAALVDDLVSGRGIGSVEGWSRAVAAAPAPAITVAAALPGPYSLARHAEGLGGNLRGGAGQGDRNDAADADGNGRHLGPDPALVRALATGLAREAASLGAAGCPMIRVDEPDALAPARVAAERDTFAAAHGELVAGAVSDVAAAHLMLALTGGDHEGIGAATLAGLGYASYLFDLIAGPHDWRLIAAIPGERGIVCGVVDAATALGDTSEVLVWAAHYAASTRGRGLARVGLATTGSLAALDADAAIARMGALGEGARIAGLPADAVRAALDPRALDMRSAALGAWSPDPRLPRRPRV